MEGYREESLTALAGISTKIQNLAFYFEPEGYRGTRKQFKKILVLVFCVQTPCSNMVEYQRFVGPCCLHLQGKTP